MSRQFDDTNAMVRADYIAPRNATKVVVSKLRACESMTCDLPPDDAAGMIRVSDLLTWDAAYIRCNLYSGMYVLTENFYLYRMHDVAHLRMLEMPDYIPRDDPTVEIGTDAEVIPDAYRPLDDVVTRTVQILNYGQSVANAPVTVSVPIVVTRADSRFVIQYSWFDSFLKIAPFDISWSVAPETPTPRP